MVGLLALVPARAQMRGGARLASGAGRSVGVTRMSAGPSHAGFIVAPRAQRFGFSHSAHPSCPGCFHPHHGYYPWWWVRAYRYPYYGYGSGYAYYSPYVWGGGASYSQDSSYESERYLTRQIDELSQEVQRLREEQEYRAYEATQARPPQAADSESAPQTEAAQKAESRKDLPTILVSRDQNIQEVQSYVIVGKDLIVVADRRSTKIPLEKLDLAATAKLNEERGVDFQMPH